MAELFNPIGVAQSAASGIYNAGSAAADFLRRINYDPVMHNAVRLRREGGISGYDAALLAKILAPGSRYQNRAFDPIGEQQNANFVALLKQLGYLQQRAL